MNYRFLGKTGFRISEISLGTWQVGGKWGSEFDHNLASKILSRAIDNGVNFIDTADVYSAGESEKAVGRAVKKSSERIYVATKCGRQIQPHVNEEYTPQVLRNYVENSLKRLDMECIDLIQLHCPPTEVFYRPEIFEEFEKLKAEGKILNLGVSIEKVEEGLKAMEFPNVTSIQVIYNIFRQRPEEKLFPQARENNVGIIARVPLASGLLTGKFSKETTFEKADHRNFNIGGEYFDVGETFSGIPYHKGLAAVERLKDLMKGDDSLVHYALNWILRREEVSCIIPGASSESQVDSNLRTSDAPALDPDLIRQMNRIYEEDIKPFVHQRW